tara:strand:- start:136 stop:333 length:198 start_codon:yes stop_codon:yes gene_type:complete
MSCLHNESILEGIFEKWDIIKCSNGVGSYETTYENERTHDTFDTHLEAFNFVQFQTEKEFEDLLQ